MFNRTRLRWILLLTGMGFFGSSYFYKTDPTFLHTVIGSAGIAMGVAGFIYALYWLHQTPSETPGLSGFLFSGFLLRGAVLPYPIIWNDLFYRYLWDGWLQVNGVSPYQFRPSADPLMLLQSDKLYDLLHHTTAFTTISPFYQFLYYPIGLFYEFFDLSSTILLLKGLSIGIDLFIIYLLYHLLRRFNLPLHYIALFAWNPLVIIFITSQGLLLQFALLFLLLGVYALHYSQYGRGAVCWGGLMLTTPLGWLGWPYFIKKSGRKGAAISLGTYLLLWLPFLRSDLPVNLATGFLESWKFPNPNLSLGYMIDYLIMQAGEITVLYYLAPLFLILALLTIRDALRNPPMSFSTFNRQLLLLATFYFIMAAPPNYGLLVILTALPVLTGRFVYTGAVLSALYLLQLAFFHYAHWLIPLLFVTLVTALIAIKLRAGQSRIGKFLTAN